MRVFTLLTRKAKRHAGTMMSSTTLPRSPFLELPREIRNLIYEHAILSCTAVESVIAPESIVTDRPLFSTVTAALHPRLPKKLCLTLRIREFSAADERWKDANTCAASPGNLLLANRQVSSEFAQEMYRHCKLVGCHNVAEHERGKPPNLVVFVSNPRIVSGDGVQTLALHGVHNFELQFNIAAMYGGGRSSKGRKETMMDHLDVALELMTNLRELTLRLMIVDKPQLINMLRSSGNEFVATAMSDFTSLGFKHLRNLRRYKKCVTMGYGSDAEGCGNRQMFPLWTRIWRLHEERQLMVPDLREDRDIRYCEFYTESLQQGYYWVRKQYQPYQKFGVDGSYEATMRAMLHGYNKWVEKGKPSWKDTEEHAEIVKRLGTMSPLASQGEWNLKIQAIGEKLGY